ncbi:MAG: MBL fold metallo-hydrolase [Hyphomicrobiaceae bacterium]|nr:MBL fold metallo-hydrolase [Hyphomicrobiaceae bacterium]
MVKAPQQQVPGVYHHRVGDIVVTAISDGFLDGSLDVLRNISQDEARHILTDNFRPARRTAVNAFLVYSAGRLALIETGSGNYLQPTAGKVLGNLKAAGVDPATIEAVLLTHMHPDHSAGLTDMATGKRNYPNAELVMHEREPAHWFDDARMAEASDREKKLYFQAGREQVAAYKDRWRLFRGEGEVFAGITAIPRPGHTPGHTTYMVSSGNAQLLIWGDTVHVPEVQTARPEVCMEFDTDQEAAAASRRKVFDMVATDRLAVTGMHLHFPGFAHLVRSGTGYRLIPAAWETEL